MADAPEIHFNRAAFEELICFIDGVEREINTSFLRPGLTLRLDESLGTFLKPGSPKWKPPVESVKGKANTFGESVYTKFRDLSDKWRTDKKNFTAALAIFQQTDDLATFSAQTFLEEYPDLGGSGY